MPEDEGSRIDYSELSPPEPMGGRGAYRQVSPASAPPAAVPTPAPETPPNQPPNQPLESPLEEEGPKSPFASIILMFVLIAILILGVLVFISWKGWISLGGLEKLWGGGKTSPTPTSQVSPTLSPNASPSSETSPLITTNVNDQTRKSDLSSIKTSLELYFADNNKFPESQTIIKTSDSSSVLAQSLVPKYLNKLPDDPLAPDFYYGYKSDGKSFELTCVLEDKTDPEGTLTGQYYIYKLTGSMAT
jgi:flagellar basal body-associated protein FliL